MKRLREEPILRIGPNLSRSLGETPARSLHPHSPENLRCTNCPENTARRPRNGGRCCGKLPSPRVGGDPPMRRRKVARDSDENTAFKGLIIDDDRGVRDFVAAVLDGAGYSVVSADNELEALILAWSSDGLDFLVTDYEIGPTNGLEIASTIRRIFPAIRVVLISGQGVELSGAEGLIDAFVAKPFRASDLCRAIQEVLNTQPERMRHA